jgi:hypothetical protein
MLRGIADVPHHLQRLIACDGAWPEEKVELFGNWVDAGCPA